MLNELQTAPNWRLNLVQVHTRASSIHIGVMAERGFRLKANQLLRLLLLQQSLVCVYLLLIIHMCMCSKLGDYANHENRLSNISR